MTLLSVKNISKAFPGVQALSDVSIDIHAGEVHAIVGENGAGKSTLMKILAGVYQPDQGQLLWEDKPLILEHPSDAQECGISIIYQEFNLLPHLTVAENVLLNREPLNRFGLIDWGALNQRTYELLGLLETHMDPERLVGSLTVAQQQIVEIIKALAVDARLIIMDEPTAALNPTEVDHLFQAITRLKERGSAIIFISHRLDEVFTISDRVTVLKDGSLVATQPAAMLTREETVRLMVGRSLEDIFPDNTPPAEEKPLLEVHGLTTDLVKDVHFSLKAGEIIGFAGLEGQGQREIARALFGLEKIRAGEIRINGQPVRIKNPRSAIRAGVAFISDDRKADGLALGLGVRENVALPNLSLFSRWGIVRRFRERAHTGRIVDALNVRTPSLDQEVRFLSGGNQQKTVLAKWLIDKPRLLVFVEPTRGIDIGAKVEIYQLMHELAQQGAGIVMVSSELLEVLGMAHRLYVVRLGEIAAELSAGDATEETVMMAATGTFNGADYD